MTDEVINWVDNRQNDGYKVVKREPGLNCAEKNVVYDDQISLLEMIRDISKIRHIIKVGSENIEGDNRSTNNLFDCVNGQIKTGNLIGVINTPKDDTNRSIRIEISSRFDKGGKNYFLMYLLGCLYGFDIFDDQISTSNETSFDVILYVMFVVNLKKAFENGLYKVYKTFRHNDYDFKGSFDVSRHIKLNSPFTGKTAYSTREYTYDNDILCMIRQTIDTIKSKYNDFWDSLISRYNSLAEIENIIVSATPSYQWNILYQNRKLCMSKITHPLYGDYEAVRVICQRILSEDGDNIFDNNDNESFALIIDMSWLWEEFVARKLLNTFDYTHIVNNGSKNGLYYSEKKRPWYPDFVERKSQNERRNVVDAKYKFWDYNSKDMHQLLSYLFLTGGTCCGAVFPVSDKEDNTDCIEIQSYKDFYSTEVTVRCFKLPFKVPDYQEDTSFGEYTCMMEKSIKDWKKSFENNCM